MCGIVGYIGAQQASPIVLEGLRRLEYRGYDSAGIATFDDGHIEIRRAEGKLSNLEQQLRERPVTGRLGIGHTRWATHGRPSEINAHPHKAGDIVVVHNGIIENYLDLRERLRDQGHVFSSETDTEIIAHLVDEHYRDCGDFASAVRAALKEVRGAYAVAMLCEQEPDKLVAAKLGSPLVVGQGQGENFVASDIPAMLSHTREMIFLEDGEMVVFTPDELKFTTLEGAPLEKTPRTITWTPLMAEKGGYRHFMLKEIYEQPQVIGDTLRSYVNPTTRDVTLPDFPEALARAPRMTLVACGTAFYACMVAKYWLEQIARVPVEVDIASEFRYRAADLPKGGVAVFVSQSGETADTLAALRFAREQGQHIVSVVNVPESTIARESDTILPTYAGPEIGVASTKAYTSQCMCFALFTIWLGQARGTISKEQATEMIAHLREIPDQVQRVLDNCDAVKALADKPEYKDAESCFFLGRNYNFPSALEGALKLKEISYIHAEGYAAGEMKHGPIALVTDTFPVINVAVQGDTYDKMVSNIQEIKARAGLVISVATEGDKDIKHHSKDVIFVPQCYEPFSPIVVAVPLQLFAYYIAVNRGCDVDQPRNLAKSVTVE